MDKKKLIVEGRATATRLTPYVDQLVSSRNGLTVMIRDLRTLGRHLDSQLEMLERHDEGLYQAGYDLLAAGTLNLIAIIQAHLPSQTEATVAASASTPTPEQPEQSQVEEPAQKGPTPYSVAPVVKRVFGKVFKEEGLAEQLASLEAVLRSTYGKDWSRKTLLWNNRGEATMLAGDERGLAYVRTSFLSAANLLRDGHGGTLADGRPLARTLSSIFKNAHVEEKWQEIAGYLERWAAVGEAAEVSA